VKSYKTQSYRFDSDEDEDEDFSDSDDDDYLIGTFSHQVCCGLFSYGLLPYELQSG